MRERHLGRRSAPALIVERASIHPDEIVEAIGIAALLRHEKDRRGLVSGERLAIDEEFVALRFAAEDRVVVQHETASALVALEEHRGGEAAQSTADRHQVVHLAS